MKKIIDYLIVGALSLIGSFLTASFVLGQYKYRFETVEQNAASTAKNLDILKLEITDRLARIETKIDKMINADGSGN